MRNEGPECLQNPGRFTRRDFRAIQGEGIEIRLKIAAFDSLTASTLLARAARSFISRLLTSAVRHQCGHDQATRKTAPLPAQIRMQ